MRFAVQRLDGSELDRQLKFAKYQAHIVQPLNASVVGAESQGSQANHKSIEHRQGGCQTTVAGGGRCRLYQPVFTQQLQETMLGENGLLKAMKPGAAYVDVSTNDSLYMPNAFTLRSMVVKVDIASGIMLLADKHLFL